MFGCVTALGPTHTETVNRGLKIHHCKIKTENEPTTPIRTIENRTHVKLRPTYLDE